MLTIDSALSGRDEIARFMGAPLRSALRALDALRRERPDDSRWSQILLYAPLYVSSYCSNDCGYCGFRFSRKAPRQRLTPEQACDEARALAEQGQRSIDLVSGESPSQGFVDQLCRTIELIRRLTPIEHIHVNVGSLASRHYRALVSAGARGCHIYQETYDPTAYAHAHRLGPKSDMQRRLDAPQRALEAGFEALGLGVLLGIAPDAAGDLAALCEHAAALARARPTLELGFSLPRLRPTPGEPAWPNAAPVNDAEFIKALIALKLRFPSAGLSLTTRETPRLRDFLLARCVTKVSAGVRVSVGGYRAGGASSSAAQFSLADERSLDEMRRVIEACGKTPVFA